MNDKKIKDPLYDVEIDTRGLFCPEPILEVNDASENLEVGQCFKVMTDDPAAEGEFKEWAKDTDTEIINYNRDNKDLVFYFRKKK